MAQAGRRRPTSGTWEASRGRRTGFRAPRSSPSCRATGTNILASPGAKRYQHAAPLAAQSRATFKIHPAECPRETCPLGRQDKNKTRENQKPKVTDSPRAVVLSQADRSRCGPALALGVVAWWPRGLPRAWVSPVSWEGRVCSRGHVSLRRLQEPPVCVGNAGLGSLPSLAPQRPAPLSVYLRLFPLPVEPLSGQTHSAF